MCVVLVIVRTGHALEMAWGDVRTPLSRKLLAVPFVGKDLTVSPHARAKQHELEVGRNALSLSKAEGATAGCCYGSRRQPLKLLGRGSVAQCVWRRMARCCLGAAPVRR